VGYTTAADKQHLEVFVCCAVHAGLYPADGPNVQLLVTDGDDAQLTTEVTKQQTYVITSKFETVTSSVMAALHAQNR